MALDVYGILGWLVYPLGKNLWFQRDSEELAEAVHEVLELGSINLYMFHGGTNFGFMNGCSARGTLDLPQVTSYDYGEGFAQWAKGNPTEVLCYSKWWRPIIGIPHSKNRSSKSVYLGNEPCNWQPRLVFFGNLDNLAPGWDQPLSRKRWKSWGKPQVIYYMRQTLGWMRKKKNCASLMVGIEFQIYLDDQHVATLYQTEIRWRSFYQRKKESGYEFKNLAWEYGTCQLWAQALGW